MLDLFYRNVFLPLKNSRDHRRRKKCLAAGQTCRSSRPERLSAIVLSYKRPRNIDKILSSLALCEFVDEIIVSNNNPELRMEDYLSVADPRIRVINQPERRFASVRLELSLAAGSEYILAIDDDIFLQPEQVRQLFEILLDNPAVVHGVGGQVYSPDLADMKQIHSRERPVEALIWLFAYTRKHAREYFEILRAIGVDNRRLDSSEDVPLSFAGENYARIHDLGPISRCPTDNRKGIATWRNPGFGENRTALVRQMRELRGFNSGLLAD